MARTTRAAFPSYCIKTLLRHYRGDLTHLGRVKAESKAGLQQTAFRILIGTILLHRTKDEKTGVATTALLARYPSPAKLSKAPLHSIRRLIKQVGFYNSKARYVKECSKELETRFGGNVPDNVDALVTLAGVGRKTAGCVVAYAFGLPAIPVDSHVHQVSNRLGLVRTSTPEETEFALMSILPRKEWAFVNEAFVKHGQSICVPVSPFCSKCPLSRHCPKTGVITSR